MHYHLLGLFPDTLSSYFASSLIGKAAEKGVIQFFYHSLRDFGVGKTKQVDDKPYGGGRGMVFLPEVVCAAVRDLKKKYEIEWVVMPSPRGQKLTVSLAKNLSQKKSILFLCGRYEGIDERAAELVVDSEISIGDFVITGGELAAAVIIDATSRFLSGVVGQEESVQKDSFEAGLLEHPHYTRPEVFEGQRVPQVLLSGNHGEIEKWRREQAIEITKARRPDLLSRP